MTIKNIRSVRGMHDCLPKDVIIWQYLEKILKAIVHSYGYNEIRFPVIEFTDLFKRAIGEITDVVEKEMYSFKDQGGDNLTLRPEGTAGCIRAGIEHSLFYHQEQRLWYCGPMFRRERPQKGRYRQFHQFSVEAFGQIGPDIDAEIILIAVRCWKALGIDRYLSLEVNSIGLVSSRIKYRKELINFLEGKIDDLDHTAKNRLYSNPMRILDMKNHKIKKLLDEAPVLSDYLDDISRYHFIELCRLLDLFEVSYTINPFLVRGLDYYNRTVFEWVTNKLGVKKTICAGGRYDDLIKQLGGGLVPAVGFSIGLERLLLLIKETNSAILPSIGLDIYIISLSTDSQKYIMLLSEYIRDQLPYLKVMMNHGGGKLKKQFQYAIKNNSKVILIIDKKNVFEKTVLLRDLQSKQEEILKYDTIISRLSNIFSS